MSFLDKAKQTAKAAAETAAERGREVAGQAGRAAAEGASRASDWGKDPETHEQARRALAEAGRRGKQAAGVARKGLVTVIEHIEPGTLADVIIRATAIQEKTNDALRKKGSLYRISEVSISASIPPGVNFAIGRLEDGDGVVPGTASTNLVGSDSDIPVLALDGTDEVEDGTIGEGGE
jgi:hypothetical protein